MQQTSIPFLFMRGGTSRGPYIRREDLPDDRQTLAKVLVAAIGSGHSLNIDGIGGGAAVTTKVAMLSRSEDEWADVDYFFAQVSVEDQLVDFKPTCGNMLSAVGPAAIEMGLVAVTGETTSVRIRAVNTEARVEAVVCTSDGSVDYDGAASIDGVPGQAAPILLNFMDVVGSSTGSLLPTGNAIDVIDHIEVTCIDVAMPMVIARAEAFGLTGYESCAELDANRSFFDRMEPIRIEAGKRMGMGDVSKSVTPKFGILAKPNDGGAIAARYFMPWTTHPSMAVTGSQCVASCVLTPNTIAMGLGEIPHGNPAVMDIEHPSGKIAVTVDYQNDSKGFSLNSAGLLRTARMLARGELMIPGSVWKNKA